MRFADKLSFLIRIANASNKELAAELSVDPSMISLMRTGKRKLSSKSDHAAKLAAFFAKRCSAEFQRRALSDMLGQATISSSMPTEVLAVHLEKWLTGDNDIISQMMDSMNTPPAAEHSDGSVSAFPIPATKNQTLFFYGIEGRREVMRRMMSEIRSMETPGNLLTAVDDNLEWLLSDYILAKQVQSQLMETIERGFTIHKIMPPLNYINRYMESLKFWLPMYATGQMEVYYYPRLRGNLYRHSIIVVPGRCVQYSASAGLGSTSDITMFSTDQTLVSAFVKQFNDYLSMCRPAIISHSEPDKMVSSFSDTMLSEGDIVQSSNTLSICTAPKELFYGNMQNPESQSQREAYKNAADNTSLFEEYLKQNTFIDIVRLASAKDVRDGKVYMCTAGPNNPEHMRYTAAEYVLHLKNILRLLDKYENYYFVPIKKNDSQNYNLLVSESGPVFMLCKLAPPLMLEMRRPEMVAACREHLLRKAEAAGYDGIYREKARMELRALIQELGG